MIKKLTPEQMKKARAKWGKHRGVGGESVTEESVYLAIDAKHPLMEEFLTEEEDE